MKTILFDFDGTIVDSLPMAVETVNELADRFGYRTVTKEDVKRFQAMTARQVLKEMRVSVFKAMFIARKAIQESVKKAGEVKVFTGMKEVIDSLKKMGLRVGIVTKSDLLTVEKVLTKAGITVDFIERDKTLFAKEKAIKRVIKAEEISSADAIFVGDEVRDVEAAKKAKLKIISVTWGYNSKEILEKNNDLFAETPKELLRILKQMK